MISTILNKSCDALFVKKHMANRCFLYKLTEELDSVTVSENDFTQKNMALGCLIMHAAKMHCIHDDFWVIFPRKIIEIIKKTSALTGLPPVGSLELFFFNNYQEVNDEIYPIYSWVENSYIDDFCGFFRIPILIEKKAIKFYALLNDEYDDSKCHSILSACYNTINNIIKIFIENLPQNESSIYTFNTQIQPFMTWGRDFDGDNNVYIGASGTMSPFFNVLHDFFNITSQSPMNKTLINSRRYINPRDLELIRKASVIGNNIRLSIRNGELSCQYNECVNSFYSLRQLHTKIAMKSIKRADCEYLSTGLTTSINNIDESLFSFRQLNKDTRLAKI